MKHLIAFFLAGYISGFPGCSTLARKEVAAGCQVADMASTAWALHHGATEENAIPVNALYIIKALLATYILRMSDDEWEASPKAIRATISVIGCAPVIPNIQAGRRSNQ